MIEFRINLIRDQVPSAGERRQRYRLMVAYLAVAGVLVVLSMGLASSRLQEARVLRQQRDQLESRFLADHPGADSIRGYAQQLDRRMARDVVALRDVEQQLTGDARPARLVRALVLSLPTGVSLRRLTLNAEEQSVLIELLVFGGTPEQEADPSRLMGQWARDPELSRQLKDVAFLGSQLEGNVARKDKLWRFTGHLNRKGG